MLVQSAGQELERKCVEEASESDSVSVDTSTSERSTLRPHPHEMDRSSNSTGGCWGPLVGSIEVMRRFNAS